MVMSFQMDSPFNVSSQHKVAMHCTAPTLGDVMRDPINVIAAAIIHVHLVWMTMDERAKDQVGVRRCGSLLVCLVAAAEYCRVRVDGGKINLNFIMALEDDGDVGWSQLTTQRTVLTMWCVLVLVQVFKPAIKIRFVNEEGQAENQSPRVEDLDIAEFPTSFQPK